MSFLDFLRCRKAAKVRDLMDAKPGWQWVHPNKGSGGPLSQEGEWTVFHFDGYEPHMLLRATGPLTGKVRLKWQFNGQARPVQGSVATVSLIIVRRGNTWSTDGEQAQYRWYHAGHAIANGGAMDVPLIHGQWTDVLGQGVTGDVRGQPFDHTALFNAALADPQYIGLAFGDPGAGATAHGVTGMGKFSFTFEVGP